jgi:cysteine desulfurase/selenocysteine lyase
MVDVAQSVAHMRVDVQKLGCDFLAFSGHKMYGPSGIGVLWVKQELLEQMEPIFSGGNMVEEVTKEKAIFAPSPAKFEAGTGKLEAVAGLGAAIDYINSLGFKTIARLDRELTEYGLKAINKIKGIQTYSSNKSKNRLPIFAFNLPGLHPHDVSEILNRNQICVRAGHHCAHVLLQVLNTPGTLRASFSIYNSTEDIDKLVKGLEEARRIFRIN